VRGRVRRAGWQRVSRGLYRRTLDLPALSEELRSWQLVLPASGAFTHLSSAQARGWWLPPLPADLPVFAAVHDADGRPRRDGLLVCRHTQVIDADDDNGIRLATGAETLLAAARDLGLLDLVVLADAALHLGDCTLDDLHRTANRRRRGAPALRRALGYVDGRSESAWESMLRMLHVACDVPVEPQREVVNSDGEFVARADLWIPGTRRVHEYDGDEHRERKRHGTDLRRERALQRAGYARYGYTSSVLLRQAVTVLRDADDALGRPHEPDRIRVWHRLLAESLFTAAGTARLRARWGLPPMECGETGRQRHPRGA